LESPPLNSLLLILEQIGTSYEIPYSKAKEKAMDMGFILYFSMDHAVFLGICKASGLCEIMGYWLTCYSSLQEFVDKKVLVNYEVGVFIRSCNVTKRERREP
jgi:hypothetical protein